jgi:hypothetical protein
LSQIAWCRLPRAEHDTAPTFLIANEEQSATCDSSEDFVVL